MNQLEVTIIGSGSYLEELKNEVQRYKLDSIIEFVGRVQPKELIPYYEKASMLYLSLDKESKISNTIPTKLQSYFAAGRGVLACIDGETSNIIKQANAGLSCPAGDYESLSKLIIQCLKDENQNAIKAYSVNTRKYFMEHFKLEKHISILTNKMEELVK